VSNEGPKIDFRISIKLNSCVEVWRYRGIEVWMCGD